MAADMSHRLGWIEQDVLDRTRKLLQRAQLPVEPPQVCACFCHANTQILLPLLCQLMRGLVLKCQVYLRIHALAVHKAAVEWGVGHAPRSILGRQ